MPVQTKVSIHPAWGVEGARASGAVASGFMGKAKTALKEGRFVFHPVDPKDRAKRYVVSSGSDVAGFAERWAVRPALAAGGDRLGVEAGEMVHCQQKGEFYAVTGNTAICGNEVFADTANGGIVCGEAAGKAPAGTCKTGFFVAALDPAAVDAATGSAPAGSTIIISSYAVTFVEHDCEPCACEDE